MKKNYSSYSVRAHAPTLKTRSRQELAEAYGVSPRTFRCWLKKHDIGLLPGLLKPIDIQKIYDHFGIPTK